MPANAWRPVSPQSHGPSSQGSGQGFGSKGGAMETPSVGVILFYISCADSHLLIPVRYKYHD